MAELPDTDRLLAEALARALVAWIRSERSEELRLVGSATLVERKAPEKLLLRPAEVAETLSIGRSKVYELIASGVIPSIKIGKAVRVPADALKAWLDEQLGSAP